MANQDHNFYAMMQSSGNYLLVKDDVGKAKPTVRSLPGGDFTYGKKAIADSEGAGKVISSWKIHAPSKDMPNDKDFKRLNVMSATKGITKASEQGVFRKNVDVRVGLSNSIHQEEKKIPDIVFGQPNRPSTPINAVIENYYGSVATEMKNQDYSRSPNIKKKSEESKLENRSPQPANVSQEKAQKKEFKMKKFQNVKSKIDNVRT